MRVTVARARGHPKVDRRRRLWRLGESRANGADGSGTKRAKQETTASDHRGITVSGAKARSNLETKDASVLRSQALDRSAVFWPRRPTVRRRPNNRISPPFSTS